MTVVIPLLFVGSPESGKSTIVNMLSNERGTDLGDYNMTFEPRLVEKRLRGNQDNVTLILIDCPGISCCKYLSASLYSSDVIFCYVFDLTRKATLEEAEALIKETEKNRTGRPDMVFQMNHPLGFLIGSKADLTNMLAVSHSTASNVAQQHDLFYFPVSKTMSPADLEKLFRQQLALDEPSRIVEQEEEE